MPHHSRIECLLTIFDTNGHRATGIDRLRLHPAHCRSHSRTNKPVRLHNRRISRRACSRLLSL